MNVTRNAKLQELCRYYLSQLKYMAKKHGLGNWIETTILANRQERCVATEREVQLLSRICNDERVARLDVPKLFGVSYREVNDDEGFDKIKKLPHLGTYSKVSALLYWEEKKNKRKKKGGRNGKV